jgi:hypothetical protein
LAQEDVKKSHHFCENSRSFRPVSAATAVWGNLLYVSSGRNAAR